MNKLASMNNVFVLECTPTLEDIYTSLGGNVKYNSNFDVLNVVTLVIWFISLLYARLEKLYCAIIR